MLMGPWALTTAGAATVAAAPAAATFRKRRRLETLSLFDVIMVFSPLDADPSRDRALFIGIETKACAGVWQECSGRCDAWTRPALTMLAMHSRLYSPCVGLFSRSANSTTHRIPPRGLPPFRIADLQRHPASTP